MLSAPSSTPIHPSGPRQTGVVHHSDCEMIFGDEGLTERMKEELGLDTTGRDCLPFSDLEQSVRDDGETLRKSDLISDEISISARSTT